ncbi:hypothetical protein LTR12_013171, partial [Friedmanniomyces endolithicus]
FALHNPALTRWLLEMGADPNASCDTEYTPLSIAVRREPLETIQFLLEHAKDSESGHLVYCATEREPESESIRIIRLLHQYEKPIDDMFWQDKRSFRNRGRLLRGTPLHNACELYNFETALTLLELGADIDKACVRDDVSVGPSPREIIESKLRELSASREDAVGRRAASWMIADRERTARYAAALDSALTRFNRASDRSDDHVSNGSALVPTLSLASDDLTASMQEAERSLTQQDDGQSLAHGP